MKKIALITGSGRKEGLGFEIARQLASKDYCVILSAAARREQNLKNLVDELKKDNFEASFVIMDITDEESAENAAKIVENQYGKLDLLINNAAIMKLGEQIEAQNLDEAKNIIDTNVIGTWNVTQKFLPLLKKSSQGKIINVSSSTGSYGDKICGLFSKNADVPPAVSYSVSKLALNGLTIHMAKEFAEFNISVNAVCPDVTKTHEEVGNFGRPVSESAAGIVITAMFDNKISGKFFRDGKEISW